VQVFPCPDPAPILTTQVHTSGTTSRNSRNWMLSMTLLRSSVRDSVASAHSPPYVATSCCAMTSDHCEPSSALACAACHVWSGRMQGV